MSEELKPCPFCGGPVTYAEKGQSLGSLVCQSEPCIGSGLFFVMDRENKHSALAAWNTRADLHTAAMGRAYVAGMEAGAEKAFNSDPYAREPDKPFDDWGDMRADTPERHAAHVLDHAMWTLANEIRALAADPAHVKAAVAKLTEGEG